MRAIKKKKKKKKTLPDHSGHPEDFLGRKEATGQIWTRPGERVVICKGDDGAERSSCPEHLLPMRSREDFPSSFPSPEWPV